MFGAIRQQAITWSSVDQVLRYHLASQGHYELKDASLYLSHMGELWSVFSECFVGKIDHIIKRLLVVSYQTAWLSPDKPS